MKAVLRRQIIILFDLFWKLSYQASQGFCYSACLEMIRESIMSILILQITIN